MSDPRAEECEVLQSIYQPSELSISKDYAIDYKAGEEGSPTSFIVQIQWPKDYPDVMPLISLDSFYNNNLSNAIKTLITDELVALAKDQLGTALTFSLIEYLRENYPRYEKLILSESSQNQVEHQTKLETIEQTRQDNVKQPKKVQLTKAQKRKQFDRMDQNGELPRGWNWVSVIKHLQQTGGHNG